MTSARRFLPDFNRSLTSFFLLPQTTMCWSLDCLA